MDAQFQFFNTLFAGMTERLAATLAPPLTNVADAMTNTTTALAAQTHATLETNEVLRDIQVGLHHRQAPSVTILLNQMGRLEPFTGENSDPQSVLAFLNGVKLRTDLLFDYTAEQLILLFGSFLAREAAIWFDLQVKPFIGVSINTLGQAVEAFKSRFLPSNYLSLTRDKLRGLKQTGDMTEYNQ